MGSITDAAKSLRADLLAAGFDAKAVTVRVSNQNILRVTIQRLGVKLADVERIARPYERIPRSPITGELLLRDEQHVHLSYARDVLAKLHTAAKHFLVNLPEYTRARAAGFEVSHLGHGNYIIDGSGLSVPRLYHSFQSAVSALSLMVVANGGTSIP